MSLVGMSVHGVKKIFTTTESTADKMEELIEEYANKILVAPNAEKVKELLEQLISEAKNIFQYGER